MWSNHPENHNSMSSTKEAREEPLESPHFDEEAIRQAKPAIPLSKVIGQRINPKVLILAVLIAGLVGSLIGSLLSVQYFNRPIESKTAASESAQASESQAKLPTDAGKASPKSANANLSAATADDPDEATSRNREKSAQEQETRQLPAPDAINEGAEDQEPDSANRETSNQELVQSFHTWLKANQDGDVDSQMGFYHSRVNAFYRKRGVSPEAVRAEKSRVLGRANAIQIEAGEPDVKLSPDGRQATIRFRKRYKIEGEEGNREGEVLQELRWKRVNSKWQIVSERDVKVLNRD
jgi:hypothetical protein